MFIPLWVPRSIPEGLGDTQLVSITSLTSQEAEISERSSSSQLASYRACDVVRSRFGLHWPTLKSDNEEAENPEQCSSSQHASYRACDVVRSRVGPHWPSLKPLTSLLESQEFAALWVSWRVHRDNFFCIWLSVWCKYKEIVLSYVKA